MEKLFIFQIDFIEDNIKSFNNKVANIFDIIIFNQFNIFGWEYLKFVKLTLLRNYSRQQKLSAIFKKEKREKKFTEK